MYTSKTSSKTKGARLTFVDRALILGVALDVFGEPLVKLVMGVKERRHYEVEERPQLGHAVLYRCACRQARLALIPKVIRLSKPGLDQRRLGITRENESSCHFVRSFNFLKKDTDGTILTSG